MDSRFSDAPASAGKNSLLFTLHFIYLLLMIFMLTSSVHSEKTTLLKKKAKESKMQMI